MDESQNPKMAPEAEKALREAAQALHKNQESMSPELQKAVRECQATMRASVKSPEMEALLEATRKENELGHQANVRIAQEHVRHIKELTDSARHEVERGTFDREMLEIIESAKEYYTLLIEDCMQGSAPEDAKRDIIDMAFSNFTATYENAHRIYLECESAARMVSRELAESERRMQRIVDDWVWRDDSSDPKPAFTDPRYPLKSEDPHEQSVASKTFIKELEAYKERKGLTWEGMASRLGTTDETLRKYRNAPEKTPAEVAETLCELASVTMVELRGLGDPYNKLLRDGTTSDALLEADLIKPEHVAQLYRSADQDTKKQITLALQAWIRQTMLNDRVGKYRGREYFLKSTLRKRLKPLPKSGD